MSRCDPYIALYMDFLRCLYTACFPYKCRGGSRGCLPRQHRKGCKRLALPFHWESSIVDRESHGLPG